ncbi:hypothetical protein [Nitrosomonas sp. HPC101]|uniref:hypothetical protein n=1 Tax=Nitrosomonas sp. HPC101 TaxID=1658667 RepID=UPI0023DBB88A|nr:hypothetical protein [Nitrosomonas sp. HPC101]
MHRVRRSRWPQPAFFTVVMHGCCVPAWLLPWLIGAHGAPYGRAAEHYNPVKHGLVTKVSDWPYSTFHRHVRLGTYEPDWAGTTPEPEPATTGEP